MSIRSRQTLSTSVSRKVVAYLGRRGLTHRAIAEMIGEREGFIRLVSEREYGLTCRDMVLIAAGTGMQLGELLINATRPPPGWDAPEEIKECMRRAEAAMRHGDAAERAILASKTGKRQGQ